MIVLPIEILSREFRSKLSIAKEIAKSGEKCILVPNRYINSRFFSGCTILLKSAANFETKKLQTLRDVKNKLVVLDEEGIVHIERKEEAEIRFSQSSIDCLDQILFNGVSEYKIISECYDISDKYRITGNPRFDRNIVSSSTEINKPILITSRFGDVKPDQEVEINQHVENLGFSRDSNDENILQEMFAYNKKLFEKFSEMVKALTRAFPSEKFIFRPHPSESQSYWSDFFKDQKNTIVTN